MNCVVKSLTTDDDSKIFLKFQFFLKKRLKQERGLSSTVFSIDKNFKENKMITIGLSTTYDVSIKKLKLTVT